VIPTTANPIVPASDPLRALAARLQIRLALDAPADQITAHPASADFPGAVLANAPRVTRTLTIDATYTGVPEQLAYGAPNAAVWRSTGLYAAPGELIEVILPARATTSGLAVQVGIHTDTLWDNDTWTRLPRIVATRPLDRPTVQIASGFGGPIHITVPVGTSLGELELTVSNAVAMPSFTPGSGWPAGLPHGAPWAELRGTSFILHVPTADARMVTDPTTLMSLWDEIQDKNAWLAGLSTTRPRAERFVVDRQISAGWMHSGYPMMAHLESTSELLTLTAPSTVGAWGPLHELGHNHQNLDWVLPGTTESSVNLWSVYISEEVLQLDRDLAHPDLAPANRAARIDAWLAGTDRDWSVWMALETYLQLQEAFGWDLYRRVFALYFALPAVDRPTDDEARLQTFIRLASLEAGRDLSAFFTAWGLIADPDTRGAIDHLPAWLDHPLAR
ncbi:MAG TPA: M60 family metallopeptidase, partial [Myxococcota bacterium]|nr:M60 family metallopeptidase [Myxococcota bacterium]